MDAKTTGQPSLDTGTMPENGRSSLKPPLAFSGGEHAWIMSCALVTAVAVAGTKALYAVVMGKIFDAVAKWGAQTIESDGFLAQISHWCMVMCLLGLAMWAFSGFDAVFWSMLGELRGKNARAGIFPALLNKTMAWYDSRRSGLSSLMLGIETHTRELQSASSQSLGFMVSDSLIISACLAVAFYYSYKVALVMLATGVPSVLILVVLNRLLERSIKAQKIELAQATKRATAAITAIDLVKVYNAADHEAFQYLQSIRNSSKHYFRQILCSCAQLGYIKLWMMMLFVIGFFYALVLVHQEQLTPGDALTTFYAAMTAFQSLEELGPQWIIITKGAAAARVLQSLMAEVEDGRQVRQQTGSLWPPACRGHIELRRVGFAYPSNPSKPVLHPHNILLAAGETTFLVGRSGSGKSTIGDLLLGFYEPLAGKILIDGNPIEDLSLDWIRNNIMLVQQSSTLFGDTLYQNVALGARHPAEVSAEDIRDACNMAQLQSTISHLPQGLDTMVGSGGCSLSGGQRQRVALARARLRDSPVLILDEITSGQDPASRMLVIDAVRLWRKGKTTIIITHDVSQIRADDYVYVLNDGFVVQEGLRKGLDTAADGPFASLVACADGDARFTQFASNSSCEREVNAEVSGHRRLLARQSQFSNLFPSHAGDGSFVPGGSLRRMSLGGATIWVTRHHAQQMWDGPAGTNGTGSDGGAKSEQSLQKRARMKHLKQLKRSKQTTQTPDDVTNSDRLVLQSGHDFQGTRGSNPRQERWRNSLASDNLDALDSLEMFFLERPSTHGQERKEAKGAKEVKEWAVRTDRRVPPMSVIIQTVWSTLPWHSRLQLVFGLVACLLSAASSPAFSFVFAELLQSFWLPDSGRAEGARWAGYLAVVATVDAAATFSSFFLMEQAGQAWVDALRAEAFRRILSQPKAWFDTANHSPTRIAECLDQHAEDMRKLVGIFVPTVLTVALVVLGSVLWALAIRWDLTLVTLCGLMLALAVAQIDSAVDCKWTAACNEAAEAAGAICIEALCNIRVVRALTLERYFTEKHRASVIAAYRFGRKRAVRVGFWFGLGQAAPFFVTALVFYYGTKILQDGTIDVAVVLQVINLLLFSLGSSTAMLANIPQVATARVTAAQMLHYANLSFEASHEASGAVHVASPFPIRMDGLRFAYPTRPQIHVLRSMDLQIDAGTCTAIVGTSGCGKSTIASLILRLYEPAENESDGSAEPELQPGPLSGGRHLSSLPSLPAAAASPTVGKSSYYHHHFSRGSTLPPHRDDVLFRHPTQPQPPTSLTFAHIPANQIHTAGLRTHMAYVPQQAFLFPGSVAYNILYGLRDDSPLRVQALPVLSAAARAAGIHDFIASLPDGYNTLVGEGGLTVSGGQAQRLALARALVRQPRLLVLDEPTSGLDSESAEGVRRALRHLVDQGRGVEGVKTKMARTARQGGGEDIVGGRRGLGRGGVGADMAIVVITHSTEMMRMADRIVVVDDGRVVETGSYDELIARRGRLADLVLTRGGA